MFTLYGSAGSPFVARILMQAAVKGIDLKLVPAPFGTPEFARMNPLGKMPVLEHDGFVLPESAVIMEYLEDAVPTPSLLGGDARTAARARLIGRTLDLYCMGGNDLLRALADPTYSVDTEGTKAALTKGLTALEAFLEGGGWALGGDVTVADCTLASWLFYIRMLPPAVYDIAADRPKLAAYADFAAGQPVVTDLWAKMDEAFRAFMARRAAAAKG